MIHSGAYRTRTLLVGECANDIGIDHPHMFDRVRPIVEKQQRGSTNYGDQFMPCPECGGTAESDAVDVGVGLYIAGNYWCECGWEIGADGKMNVATYDDYFVGEY